MPSCDSLPTGTATGVHLCAHWMGGARVLGVLRKVARRGTAASVQVRLEVHGLQASQKSLGVVAAH